MVRPSSRLTSAESSSLRCQWRTGISFSSFPIIRSAQPVPRERFLCGVPSDGEANHSAVALGADPQNTATASDSGATLRRAAKDYFDFLRILYAAQPMIWASILVKAQAAGRKYGNRKLLVPRL